MPTEQDNSSIKPVSIFNLGRRVIELRNRNKSQPPYSFFSLPLLQIGRMEGKRISIVAIAFC